KNIMSAHINTKIPAVLKLHQSLLPLKKRAQKLFSPQNRPFICYLVFVALALLVANSIWSKQWKLPAWMGTGHAKLFNGEFLTRKLGTTGGFWGIELGSLLFFWLITRPVELRQHRWVRIA